MKIQRLLVGGTLIEINFFYLNLAMALQSLVIVTKWLTEASEKVLSSHTANPQPVTCY
jgi:hypothetical protein